MRKLLHIARFSVLTVLLSALLAVAPAVAQNVVHQGETTPLGVVEVPGETYQWELYTDSTQNFATYPGDCPATSADFVGASTGATVNVQWKLPGTYFFKVTAWTVTGCTNNLRVGKMKVLPAIPTAKLTTEAICEGDPLKIHVSLTGTAPWSFTITDGTNSYLYTAPAVADSAFEATIIPPPKVSTSYWVPVVKDKWGINTTSSDTVLQVVNPKPATSVIYQYEP
jgi:hypothetical protein